MVARGPPAGVSVRTKSKPKSAGDGEMQRDSALRWTHRLICRVGAGLDQRLDPLFPPHWTRPSRETVKESSVCRGPCTFKNGRERHIFELSARRYARRQSTLRPSSTHVPPARVCVPDAHQRFYMPSGLRVGGVFRGVYQCHAVSDGSFLPTLPMLLRLLTRVVPSRGFLLPQYQPSVSLIAVTRGCLHHQWMIM